MPNDIFIYAVRLLIHFNPSDSTLQYCTVLLQYQLSLYEGQPTITRTTQQQQGQENIVGVECCLALPYTYTYETAVTMTNHE